MNVFSEFLLYLSVLGSVAALLTSVYALWIIVVKHRDRLYRKKYQEYLSQKWGRPEKIKQVEGNGSR